MGRWGLHRHSSIDALGVRVVCLQREVEEEASWTGVRVVRLQREVEEESWTVVQLARLQLEVGEEASWTGYLLLLIISAVLLSAVFFALSCVCVDRRFLVSVSLLVHSSVEPSASSAPMIFPHMGIVVGEIIILAGGAEEVGGVGGVVGYEVGG